MKKPKAAMGIVVAFALAAVVMAVVSVKMSPLDKTAFVVEQPYLRSSLPTSTSAAAFLVLRNETGSDDRLIAVRSALSGRVELHSHTQDANGVMRMGPIEGGVPLAKGSSHSFVRGGDHLMFTGLEAPLEQGQLVPVTLVFEKAGEIEITVPVDQER
ncbi:copper chaperone PCu(A)C [Sulfitobacter sp. S223]|uniref:copper chaperone PCu(A)C n=1 Tax=Sulfitobacter sp. S223 TaxID=2867023 RepID=UPI0021A32D37|nr:copper chaperone PCu(A)C [Sulfitobacter sp. S223]UWR25563.1 copper chaperone PCu(A)C [Sulfitobacter sp. S223]